MRRTAGPDVDLSVYVKAVPLLVRNPSIVVVPVLMAVVGVFLQLTMMPYRGGTVGGLTGQLASFVVILLELFGLGAACIIADDAWRHGRASFEKGWAEARSRGGDILFAALGFTLLLAVAQYAGTILGPLAIALIVLVVVFVLWAIPAAAVGGVPGGAAIQVSIDRVRGAPLPATIAAIVTVALLAIGVPFLSVYLGAWIPMLRDSLIMNLLVSALLQGIAVSYIALILTKTYTDAAFGTRRW
ncbi:MAG: hypothetical protein QOF71_1024 [Candidatus Eremiobacteraeota bacterium]|jgi:hypothetical protein|nr:hypothetical protein [Candidatus Eremiobacteraeota bacterium]